jgi:hypothetical protein
MNTLDVRRNITRAAAGSRMPTRNGEAEMVASRDATTGVAGRLGTPDLN